MTQFNRTRTGFMRSFSDLSFPITYETWSELRPELQTAAIFINFYNTFTLAWYKSQGNGVLEEDALSILFQYLIKNVAQGKVTKKTFTKEYFFTVGYNSMASLRRTKTAKDTFELNVPQYATNGDEEFDLFERIISDVDMEDVVYRKFAEPMFNRLLESLDKSHKAVVDYLIGERKSLGKKTEMQYDEILTDLKRKFNKFRPIFCEEHHSDVMRFAQVWKSDDNVASAVVEMSNGTLATYYGETREMHNGSIRVVFFGPDQDYIIPLERAKALKVVDVEMY